MDSEPLTVKEFDEFEAHIGEMPRIGPPQGIARRLLAAARRCAEAERRYRELRDAVCDGETLADAARTFEGLGRDGSDTYWLDDDHMRRIAAVLSRHASERQEAHDAT